MENGLVPIWGQTRRSEHVVPWCPGSWKCCDRVISSEWINFDGNLTEIWWKFDGNWNSMEFFSSLIASSANMSEPCGWYWTLLHLFADAQRRETASELCPVTSRPQSIPMTRPWFFCGISLAFFNVFPMVSLVKKWCINLPQNIQNVVAGCKRIPTETQFWYVDSRGFLAIDGSLREFLWHFGSLWTFSSPLWAKGRSPVSSPLLRGPFGARSCRSSKPWVPLGPSVLHYVTMGPPSLEVFPPLLLQKTCGNVW